MSDLSAGLQAALQFAQNYSRNTPPKWRPPTGDEIRGLRHSLGMSQPQFAITYGFTVAQIRQWENNRATPEQVSAMVLRMIESDREGVAELVRTTRARPNVMEDA